MGEIMTVEKFAENVMGVKLTHYQIDMIGYIRAGKTIHAPIRSGQTVARRVQEAYDHYLDANTVKLPCLECGKLHRYLFNSNEAQGIFNVFCDGECEDKYAWKE